MTFLRSILSVVIGIGVALGSILFVQRISQRIYAPDANPNWENKAEVRAFIESLPVEAFVLVLLSYAAGCLFGGGMAALIAKVWRTFHAGIIGALVLAATVGNFAMMKRTMDIDHPDWMILIGLLQPLPLSLIAGTIVSKLVQGRKP